ncbi:RT0821/Lpp0805 family surface protein [Arvimicrobium flavum]|uniref:RT0821/Lpp0805 family surface protein n=1 Tax=Arvimicrobium flavum TaxID=3393320 RepID=UPI00237B65BE|nr:RT0821/Lpp0805 family surface protein [Mesorhizobium shangrilense]
MRNAQALGVRHSRGRSPNFWNPLAILALVLPLAGCGAGGFDLSKADVDRTLQTGSVGYATPTPDSTSVSDSLTIRNAVSAADVEALGGGPLAWANADTGSRGTITGVAETRAAGALCRTFTASRESYDGVGMYKGEACQGYRGAWRMKAFDPM